MNTVVESSTSTFSSARWWIVIAVMLVTTLEVLDMTIVSVALPHLMASLECNTEQITWVLTAYIVAAAITMPLMGFLVKRMGRKRLLLLNIAGFCVFSTLCGLSQDLTQMVLFRVGQGIFGACLVPLSQYILRDTFPPEEQRMAFAIWGVGVMIAPIIGPTLGAYITEHAHWRWMFFLNIPLCALSFFLSLRFVTDTVKEKAPIDLLGLVLLVTGIGCLQLVLDRGNTVGWWDSFSLRIQAFACVISLILFIPRMRHPHSLIHQKTFKNLPFSLGILLVFLFIGGLIGLFSLQAIFFQTLLHYSLIKTGELFIPRGIASAIAMFLAGTLLKKVDNRHLLIASLLISFFGVWFMTQFAMNTPPDYLLWPMVLQGLGLGLFFVSLSTITFETLPPQALAEGSGLFSFSRSLGMSVGTALLVNRLTHLTANEFQQLGTHVTHANFFLWKTMHLAQKDNLHSLAIAGTQLKQHAELAALNGLHATTAFLLLFLIPVCGLFWFFRKDTPQNDKKTRKSTAA